MKIPEPQAARMVKESELAATADELRRLRTNLSTLSEAMCGFQEAVYKRWNDESEFYATADEIMDLFRVFDEVFENHEAKS